MIRAENHFDFSFPREVVWPVLSKTDWLNRALGFPPVKYDVKPALEGGSRVTAAASVGGLTLRWLELPFEWLEPEFHRVRRVFDGGPLREVVAGLGLTSLPQDHCRATFYSEWTPRGLVGKALALVLAKKSRRDLQRVLAHVQKFLGGRRKILLPSLPSSSVHETALQSALAKLAEFGQPPELVARLEKFLRESPDVEMSHIRAFAVARQWSLEPWAVLGLFLRATRCGLLDLRWEVLCPNCRSSRQPPISSLANIKSAAHCDVCEIKFDAEFDKSVELKFSVNRSIRALEDQTFCLAGPGGKPHILSQVLIDAKSDKLWKWPSARYSLRLQSPQVSASAVVSPEEWPGPGERLVVRCDSDKFDLTRESVKTSEAREARLINPSAFPIQVSWHQLSWSEDVLTAARVSNWQEFRELFASEVISPSERVTVGSQVVMFTDLRGSTALYHSMGDAAAYSLVRNHFAVLTRVIGTHHGAVVKTIGDAVMASFSRVDEALQAVKLAFEQLPGANPGLAAPLILKTSLHVGPCLAVNANDKLDYFGTAVNLAARMVECCDGGDLTVSDDFFQRPETAQFLEGHKAVPVSSEMRFRGFNSPHRVWKIRMGKD